MNFGNHLGLFALAGVNIKVESDKLNDDQFMTLLEEISAYLANLVFSYQGGRGPFAKIANLGKSVLYQAFMYIYSLLRQKQIQAAVYQIINNPYVKYEKEWSLYRVEKAKSSGYNTIKEIITKPQYLVKLAAGSYLQETQLSHKLNSIFPVAIYTSSLCGYEDNPENQFIKYFLIFCQKMTCRLREETTTPQIRDRLEWALTEINKMLRHQFFQKISEIEQIPFSSQVLQKKTAYKEIFTIYNRLNQLIAASDNNDWKQMIEFKDAAKLYEYWTFIKFCQTVERLLGKPLKCAGAKANLLQVELSYGLQVIFPREVRVFYNKIFRLGEEFNQSYSITLRPDIVLQVKDGIYVFDAKFKLDKLDFDVLKDSNDGENETINETSFKKADIYKMHTYRDAIRGCRGAYVLYPGDEIKIFPVNEDKELEGVGAIGMKIVDGYDNLLYIVKKILVSIQ
ncbi:MAG: DUF2357 domain-containing protein [Firmicutes bacterium]|nr:DUF2357 domain-containing protein [Bacillota bacterium]